MEKDRIPLLVRKYIKGTCTAEEREALLEWWNRAVDNEDLLNQLSPLEQEALKYRMLDAINKRIKKKEREKSPAMFSQLETSFKVYLAAASILLIAISIFILSDGVSKSTVITTAYGESEEIQLPDSSVVILNGNSSLTFAEDWQEQNERNVWLEGEAYFSIKHTVNHSPFIVHSSDNLKVKVLGTKFNVNNRRGVTEVVLNEGKVQLQHNDHAYVMKPNEMVSFSKSNPVFVLQKVDAAEKTSWKERMLIYEDEAIGAIAKKLEDSYGLKIIFKNKSIASETFSGSIPTDSVYLFIEKIEKLYHVEVAKNAGVYLIE